jgi:hypothetical protein
LQQSYQYPLDQYRNASNSKIAGIGVNNMATTCCHETPRQNTRAVKINVTTAAVPPIFETLFLP